MECLRNCAIVRCLLAQYEARQRSAHRDSEGRAEDIEAQERPVLALQRTSSSMSPRE